jgi:hypothetical protein
MTVLEVFNFAVKPERLNEVSSHLKAFEARTQQRPDLWGSMRSYHVYTKLDGSKSIECVEVCEFDNLADVEKNYEAVKQDKEYLTVHYPAFTEVIIPGTLGREVWNALL